jgi:competence protein ComEC
VARFEPSVLRAATMAAVMLLTKAIGRPQPLLRILVCASFVLLILDPLLVRSVGFGLSAGAVAGIAVLEPQLRVRLNRFGPLAPLLSVTFAAQLGTAPILLLVFDGLPVVSVLANLLALPLAAPVMGWGVVAGLPAGLLGPGASSFVHIPTQFLLRAIALVAKICSRLSVGSFGVIDAALVIGIVVLISLMRAFLRPGSRTGNQRQLAPWALLAVLCVPLARTSVMQAVASAPPRQGILGPGATWIGKEGGFHKSLDVLVLDHGVSAPKLLTALRHEQVTSIGLVVVASGGKPQRDVLRALAHRTSIRLIVSAVGISPPPGVRWKRPTEGLVLRSGRATIGVDSIKKRRLVLTVRDS